MGLSSRSGCVTSLCGSLSACARVLFVLVCACVCGRPCACMYGWVGGWEGVGTCVGCVGVCGGG